MPTSRRTSSIFFRSLANSTPSMMTRPCWCSSSRLMQRIIVDLPEPDGPQITMRSPPFTRRSMSRSTWKSPYHLLTLIRSTAIGVFKRLRFSAMATASLILRSLSIAVLGEARFHRARVARHAVAEHEIEGRAEGVAGRRGHRRRPFRVDARHFDRVQQIENANDGNERGVLEQADIGVDDVRDGDAQRLRQDDVAHHQRIAQADRHRAFELALRDRLQA